MFVGIVVKIVFYIINYRIIIVSDNINTNSIIYDLRSKDTVFSRLIYLIKETVTGKIIVFFILIFIIQYFLYDYISEFYFSGQSKVYDKIWKDVFTVNQENIRVINTILSIFSHANLIHLFINSTILLSFGIVIEDFIKSTTFISLFIIGGIVSTLIQISFIMMSYQFDLIYLYTNNVMILGASGSILSVIGASAIKQPEAEVRLIILPFIKFDIIEISLAFATISITIIPIFGIGAFNISHISHISGLLFGYWFGYNRFSTAPIKKYFNIY